MSAVRKVYGLLIFITAFSLTVVSCADKKHISVQAPKDIRQSFAVTSATPHLAVDGLLIGIQKTSLEKEFLLRSQLISQAVVARFQGLRSRIVAFRQHGDEILMLEATQGHMVDSQVPAALLLAKFKIVKEVDGVLYFDLNQGLSDLYVTGDWYVSDFGGTFYDEGPLFRSAPLQSSYIEEAKFDAANRLVVAQVGILKSSVEGTITEHRPVRAKFYLSPYDPDPTFEKSKSYFDFSQFGYFEVIPQFANHGWSETYVTKFNVKAPIEYAISANTPAEFKDAVREGILYWNKAFGREMIKVTDAPQGVTAPDSTLNIVQWVKWDWAGGAYADGQMDPRTGQILHAQIFMTSVFAISGKDAARRFLRTYSQGKPAGFQLGLKGFMPSTLCHREIDASFATRIAEMVESPDVTDQDILRAAQDYVREVMAHEVGHTLGLRHNFAGSTAANYKLSEKNNIFSEYLKHARVPADLITTSSVMEYSDFIDGALTGHQMKAQTSALPYDERAIRHIYDGVEYGINEVPLYCTDSSQGKFLDCKTFDSSPSVVESAYRSALDYESRWNERLFGAFIAAKSPPPNQRETPVERVTLDIDAMMDTLIEIRMPIIAALEKESRLLSVERLLGVVDGVNREEAQAKKMDAIAKDVERLGGLDVILAPWTDAGLEAQIEKLDKMMQSGSVDKGMDRYDRPYQFTSTELALIRRRMEGALTEIYKRLPERELKKIAEWKGELANHPLSDAFATVLQNRVEEVLFATSGQTISGTVQFNDGKKSAVHLPNFKYSQKVREAAYKVLSAGTPPRMDWAYLQKKAIKERFEKLFTEGFTENWKSVVPSSMSSDVLRWYLENRAIWTPMERDETLLSDPAPEKKEKKGGKKKP